MEDLKRLEKITTKIITKIDKEHEKLEELNLQLIALTEKINNLKEKGEK